MVCLYFNLVRSCFYFYFFFFFFWNASLVFDWVLIDHRSIGSCQVLVKSVRCLWTLQVSEMRMRRRKKMKRRNRLGLVWWDWDSVSKISIWFQRSLIVQRSTDWVEQMWWHLNWLVLSEFWFGFTKRSRDFKRKGSEEWFGDRGQVKNYKNKIHTVLNSKPQTKGDSRVELKCDRSLGGLETDLKLNFRFCTIWTQWSQSHCDFKSTVLNTNHLSNIIITSTDQQKHKQ